MDEDIIFTKRFVDCIKKPHSERTEEVSELAPVAHGVNGGLK